MPLRSTYIPSPADVERYQRLRGLARDLNHRIIQTIPPEAFRRLQKPSVGCKEECWCWVAKMSPTY